MAKTQWICVWRALQLKQHKVIKLTFLVKYIICDCYWLTKSYHCVFTALRYRFWSYIQLKLIWFINGIDVYVLVQLQLPIKVRSRVNSFEALSLLSEITVSFIRHFNLVAIDYLVHSSRTIQEWTVLKSSVWSAWFSWSSVEIWIIWLQFKNNIENKKGCRLYMIWEENRYVCLNWEWLISSIKMHAHINHVFSANNCFLNRFVRFLTKNMEILTFFTLSDWDGF